MIKNKALFFSLIPILALVAFFFFRIQNLNTIPVFVDEAIYIRWSQVMKNEASLRFLPLSDGKQPLFMWVTIPFFKIINDPLVAGRSVSIATGLGSLVGVVFLTQLVFSIPAISFLAAFIYAVLPFTVFFDRMALADSMLAMFGVWSLAFSILFLKTKKTEHAMYLGYALGGGLLTKSPAIFFYLWAIACVPFFANLQHNRFKEIGKIITGLIIAVVISQVMYGILRLGPNFHLVNSRNQDYLYSWNEVLSHPLSPLMGNLTNTLNWLWLLLTPASILFYCFAPINKQFRKQFVLLSLLSFIPLIAQASIAKVYTSRYILFAIYPLIPLISAGAYWLISRKGLLFRLVAIVLSLIPLAISSAYVYLPEMAPLSRDMRSGYLEEWTAGTGQKEVASYLNSLTTNGAKIVIFTEGFFGTLPDGLQIYTQRNGNITVVGSSPFVSQLPQGLINTSPDNLRFLLINKSRNHLSSSDLNKLQLVKEYPKAVRPDGSREALLLYRYNPVN